MSNKILFFVDLINKMILEIKMGESGDGEVLSSYIFSKRSVKKNTRFYSVTRFNVVQCFGPGHQTLPKAKKVLVSHLKKELSVHTRELESWKSLKH